MRISDWSSDVCSSDLFGEAEDLGERPGGGVGFEPFDRARAEDQHAVTALAAEHFLPAEGRNVDLVPRQVISEHRAGRIGEAKAGAVVGDPVAIGDANAAGGAVDRKSTRLNSSH